MKKKFFAACAACGIALGTVLSAVTPAHADVDTGLGGTGSISGFLGLWDNANARQFINGNGIQPNGTTQVTAYDQVPIYLKNANGDILAEALSGNNDRPGEYHFTNLPDGTYYIDVADANTLGVEAGILPAVDLNMTNLGTPYKNADMEPITVSGGAAVTDVNFAMIHKAYAVDLTTAIGSYEYSIGGVQKSEKSMNLYRGGNLLFEYSGRKYFTNLGVLATDRLNDLRSSLPTPTLTQAEQDYGYSFAGWKANDSMLTAYPELANQIFTTDEVLSIRAKGNMSFHAVFTYPIHRVTFATDQNKGELTLNGQTGSYVFQDVEGNTSSVKAIPSVNAKDGYEFLGWYADATTNVLPDNDILSAPVPRNITYYAKYRAILPEVSSRATIDPIVEGATEVTGTATAGAQITFTPARGAALTTTAAADGSWSVTLPQKAVAGQVYSVQQTEPSKTISQFTDATVIRALPQKSANPTVKAVTVGDATVSGTGVAGAIVRVSFPSGSSENVTVGADGTWSAPVTIPLTPGGVVSAVQTETDKMASSSVDVTVMAQQLDVSPTPIINAVKVGDTSVSGTGVEGAQVSLTFKDGTVVDVVVAADRSWSAQVPASASLTLGDNIQATQLVTGKMRSTTSDATVVADVQDVSRHAIIWAVTEGDSSVGGQGVPHATIAVTFKDGTVVETTVDENGAWKVSVPESAPLKYGDNVSVVQTELGKAPSSATDATAVHSSTVAPSPVPPVIPGRHGMTSDSWTGGSAEQGTVGKRAGGLSMTGSETIIASVAGMLLALGAGMLIGKSGRRRES